MSTAQSTATQIAQKGGVTAAVASDVASAAIKSSMEQGSTAGDIEEFAKKMKMDPASAKEFAKQIMTGSMAAKELLAQGITGAAASLASATSAAKTSTGMASVEQAGGKDGYVALSTSMAKGKTAGDKERLSHFDSTEEYVESERKKAGTQATADKTRLALDNNQDLTDNVVNKTIETATKLYFGSDIEAQRQKAVKQLTEVGALQTDSNGNPVMDENGKYKATTGIAFSNAFASLGALDMERGKQFMVAGTSMTMDRGRGGEVRMQATSQDSTKRGEDASYAWKGYLGFGEAVLAAGGVVAGADRAVKTFSPSKRGIIERVYGDGGKKGSAFNNAMNKSGNPSDSQNNSYPNSDIGDKTVSKQHNNSPSINSRISNSTIKTPEAKSWYKEMGKSFMKSKAGKTVGVVGGLVGMSSFLGADEPQEGNYPSGDMGSQPSQPNIPPVMSTMDTAMIMGTATVANGVTAAFGVQELKAGQQVATKAVEKTGGKLLGKMAGKLIPGVGLYYGAKYASDEFDKGNYGRATMEMLSGVTSLVPGIGTLASAAIDMGLATESVMNPEQEKQKLQTVSGAKPKTVAAAALGMLATSSQRTEEQAIAGDSVIRKLRVGESGEIMQT